MIKVKVNNPRYPHVVVITRLNVDDDQFKENDQKEILYIGCGRSFTDTTTYGDAKMDYNRRKCSIPVRYDEWRNIPLDGDVITVKLGGVIERGIIRDIEPDNNRTLVYWEFQRA